MEDIVDAISKGEKPYINNLSRIFDDYPQMMEDLELNAINKFNPQYRNMLFAVNLFVGGFGTRSSLHCAAPANFFLQIAGQKKWSFINPKYSMYLNPVGAIPYHARYFSRR